MKKVFLTAMLVIMTTTAFSQVTFKPGVRAGVNFSNITNSSTDDKTDFYIGIFGELKLADFYAIQPEINYSRQGADSRSNSAFDIELQYVSLAVANKFSPFNKLGLHFIVGPAINIKVNDQVDDFFTSAEDIDLVIFGGIGYDFPFNLSVETRYNIGLVDIFPTVGNDIFVNRVIQIGATYKFDL
jgi:hypothetical protein